MKQNENKVLLHTRFGLRLLQVLIIVLCMVLVMRCVAIYQDNKIIDEQVRVEYFDKGFASGMKKSQGLPIDPEPQFKNYALNKAYRDGYRQGWDSGSVQGKRN